MLRDFTWMEKYEEATSDEHVQYVKYYFESILFLKNNLLGKTLQSPFFTVLSSDFKHIFSMKKNCNIDSSLPYLIDVDWLNGFIFRAKLLERKSQL